MRDKFTFSHRTNKDISYLFTKRISFLEIYLGIKRYISFTRKLKCAISQNYIHTEFELMNSTQSFHHIPVCIFHANDAHLEFL